MKALSVSFPGREKFRVGEINGQRGYEAPLRKRIKEYSIKI
jgi:hypothetical protein